MAEEQNSAERSEQPTPRRRQEDFEKGDAQISQEASIAGSFLVLFLAVVWLLPSVGPQMVGIFRRSLVLVGLVDGFGRRVDIGRSSAVEILRQAGLDVLQLSIATAVASMSILVLFGLLQVGPRFHLHRLGFEIGRLNPVSGLQRIISWQFFVSLLKALIKGVGLVSLAVVVLADRRLELWKLPFQRVSVLPDYLASTATRILMPVIIVVVALGLLDIAWIRYRKEQGLKMSKQQVKEEAKSDSGDPKLRQARRQRMRELVSGQPLKESVKEATVVATNPTHYAVALRYRPGQDHAPVVVAKGKDYRAKRIREIAASEGVPVMEDKPLARGLFALAREGQVIPRELFESVARLLAVVYQHRDRMK